MNKHKSARNKILKRIRGHGRGWVFTPKSFDDLASSTDITSALYSLKKDKVIRSLARGLYDFPEEHPVLGALLPSADDIAKAIAGRDDAKLLPSGSYAANQLGLSEQVPMKVIFLTNSLSRRITVGKQEIIFKRTTPKNMAVAGRISGLVFQALKHIGMKRVDEELINRLNSRLSSEQIRQLKADLSHAPAWIADIIRELPLREQHNG